MSAAPTASETAPLSYKARLILLVIRLIGMLPLSAARVIGAIVGWVCWRVDERGARTTKTNIAICFPHLNEEQQRKLVKRSVVHTGILAAEMCVIYQREPAWLERKIKKIVGEPRVQHHIDQGKGLIMLAPHLGNWEVLSLFMPRFAKVTALYQPPKQAYLETLIKTARQKTGATLVPATRRGLVQILTSLKQGGITGVLPDQNPEMGAGAFSPFYGEPAYTMTMVHGMLKRTESPLMVCFAKRVPGGFEIHMIDPPEGIYSPDQATSLAAMNEAVETCIKHCPVQYQWEYKRFKHPVDGGQNRYA